jgi:predicted nucleic acid-binding protein
MRVVLDTNVVISGIFFAGTPARIVDAWIDDEFDLAMHALLVLPEKLPDDACTDRDDIKFLECALGCRAECVVSGDRALLRASGYEGVAVLAPRQFALRYLRR